MKLIRIIGAWFAPDPRCSGCGHPGDAHEHYRAGTDCALCPCSARMAGAMKTEIGPPMFAVVAFLFLAIGVVFWDAKALSMLFLGLASGTAIAGLWWLARTSGPKS